MPIAKVRGFQINYETFGNKGPWIALSPGSRRSYAELVSLSRTLAASDFRVLLHDRRNCGVSDVVIEGKDSEYEIWADDLHELLAQLNALPAYVGGSSSGCRLSILFALRHPRSTSGLLLWRISGGKVASVRLAENYYGQFIKAAERGGMAAVCDTEFFRERIKENSSNRPRLMNMDPKDFISVMANWEKYFLEAAEMPVIGATEDELRGVTVPTCLIPGNDQVHSPQTTRDVQRLLSRSEVHELVSRRPEDDLMEEWDKDEWFGREAAMAAIFLDFLKRAEATRK